MLPLQVAAIRWLPVRPKKATALEAQVLPPDIQVLLQK